MSYLRKIIPNSYLRSSIDLISLIMSETGLSHFRQNTKK